MHISVNCTHCYKNRLSVTRCTQDLLCSRLISLHDLIPEETHIPTQIRCTIEKVIDRGVFKLTKSFYEPEFFGILVFRQTDGEHNVHMLILLLLPFPNKTISALWRTFKILLYVYQVLMWNSGWYWMCLGAWWRSLPAGERGPHASLRRPCHQPCLDSGSCVCVCYISLTNSKALSLMKNFGSLA